MLLPLEALARRFSVQKMCADERLEVRMSALRTANSSPCSTAAEESLPSQRSAEPFTISSAALESFSSQSVAVTSAVMHAELEASRP